MLGVNSCSFWRPVFPAHIILGEPHTSAFDAELWSLFAFMLSQFQNIMKTYLFWFISFVSGTLLTQQYSTIIDLSHVFTVMKRCLVHLTQMEEKCLDVGNVTSVENMHFRTYFFLFQTWLVYSFTGIWNMSEKILQSCNIADFPLLNAAHQWSCFFTFCASSLVTVVSPMWAGLWCHFL